MPAAPAAGFRPGLRLCLLTAAALAVLVGLGAWQLERRAWKHALLHDMETRLALPPAPFPDAAARAALDAGTPAWESLAWRRWRVPGEFDHDREVYWFTLHKGRAGRDVITPLRLPDGGWVLVDRGFVPQGRNGGARPVMERPTGSVEVTGRARPPQVRRWFDPPDDPAARLWFVRSPAAMARAMGLERAAPVLLETAGSARAEIRDNHLVYALTWFGLALALAGVFVVYHLPGRSRT